MIRTNPSIQTGDIVDVNFNAAQNTLGFRMKVIHIPHATGDSWIFEDEAKQALHYVSEPCTVTKFTGCDTQSF